jgi:hypothetical protein
MKLNPLKRFNRANALILAKFAALAYLPGHEIEKALPGYRVTSIDEPETDTQVLIADDDDSIIIAPRGSTNLNDWLTNLNTDHVTVWHPMPGKPITYHEGFYNAYKSVSDRIVEVIKNNPGKDIYLGGHSLGAAITNVMMVDLCLVRNIPVKCLYTFGSPRVFDYDSAEYVNTMLEPKMHRVVNNSDIVTHVPPELTGYSHTGGLCYFEESGELHVREGLSWWKLKQYELFGILSDIGEPGLDRVKDHNINDYIDYLKAIKKPQ